MSSQQLGPRSKILCGVNRALLVIPRLAVKPWTLSSASAASAIAIGVGSSPVGLIRVFCTASISSGVTGGCGRPTTVSRCRAAESLGARGAGAGCEHHLFGRHSLAITANGSLNVSIK